MDNYFKLFGETRPETQENNIFEVLQNIKVDELIQSEWLNYFLQAVKFYENNNLQNALLYSNKAIELKTDNPHLFEFRAKIKEDMGDGNGAISDYKKYLFSSGDDSYSTYNQIAINYLNLKVFDKSLLAFDIAIDLKQKNQNIGISEDNIPNQIHGVVKCVRFEKMYTNRANVKLSLKDYQGCLDDCNTAININDEYANSYFILGLLFINVNQNDDAFTVFKIAQSKGHPHASAALKQFFN